MSSFVQEKRVHVGAHIDRDQRDQLVKVARRRDRSVSSMRVVAVLPLPSVAELVHVTTVRPTLKRLPEAGRHVIGRVPSTSSVALTLKVTRTRFARLAARTVSVLAPVIVGAVRSNSSPAR